MAELARRARRPDPTVEVDRFHALWEAAAEASDKPDGPTGAIEDLGTAYLSPPIMGRAYFRGAAAAAVLGDPPPRQAATPLQEFGRSHTREMVQEHLGDLKEKIRRTRILLAKRQRQAGDLIEFDEFSLRRERLKGVEAMAEVVRRELAASLKGHAEIQRIQRIVFELQSRVEELRRPFPGKPS
ncbi:hypothetical protein [Streptomyces hydrogenans]